MSNTEATEIGGLPEYARQRERGFLARFKGKARKAATLMMLASTLSGEVIAATQAAHAEEKPKTVDAQKKPTDASTMEDLVVKVIALGQTVAAQERNSRVPLTTQEAGENSSQRLPGKLNVDMAKVTKESRWSIDDLKSLAQERLQLKSPEDANDLVSKYVSRFVNLSGDRNDYEYTQDENRLMLNNGAQLSRILSEIVGEYAYNRTPLRHGDSNLRYVNEARQMIYSRLMKQEALHRDVGSFLKHQKPY